MCGTRGICYILHIICRVQKKSSCSPEPLRYPRPARLVLRCSNLSDATGNGGIIGGIPHQWIGISPHWKYYNATSMAPISGAPQGLLGSYMDYYFSPFYNPLQPTLTKLKVM